MKTKEYILPLGSTGLIYNYDLMYHKWIFRVGNHCLLVNCKGNETAHKIARVIAGSYKRSGELDNLARSNISRLTFSQQSAN